MNNKSITLSEHEPSVEKKTAEQHLKDDFELPRSGLFTIFKRRASAERLEAALSAYSIQINFDPTATNEQGDAAKLTKLIAKSRDALRKGKIDVAWHCFHQAKCTEINLLSGETLKATAITILAESDTKLGAWRKKAMKEILTNDGTLKADLKPAEVASAARLLYEHYDNTYLKLATVRQQFLDLSICALVAVIAFLILLNAAPFPGSGTVADYSAAALFGVMGAAMSGLLSLSKTVTQGRIPERLAGAWISLTRLVIGAVAALASYNFLISNLLQLGKPVMGLILSIAFVSGFSERLVVRTVETISNSSESK